MSEWISVEDRLPEISGDTVLAVCFDYPLLGRAMTVPAKYIIEKEEWYDVECVDNCGEPNQIFQVTHWMPLPEPPK